VAWVLRRHQVSLVGALARLIQRPRPTNGKGRSIAPAFEFLPELGRSSAVTFFYCMV
jgi:hypothetical protein